mmetsp:Transcript_50146/g.144500  ORF Transcript_50146/g.144500 Transcript_50146/m.144500 type:complete len:780 (-) Transcript_50146:9-2348(-)
MEYISFGWGSAASLVALSLYYGDERSILHRGVAEYVFWTCMYAWVALVFLLLPDSPLNQARLLISVGGADHVALVLLAGVVGNRIHSRRRATRTAPLQQRWNLQEGMRLQAETVPARIATSRICECLSARQGGLLTRLCRSTRKQRGDAILTALTDCCDRGPEHLLYVLNTDDIELPQLFEFVRPQELLDLLLDHASDMDVVTKARLIDAMQRQRDFFFERPLQEFVAALLKCTSAEELTTLKNLLDEGGDFYNLHKLVFSDLVEDLREDVLRHIEIEGATVRANSAVLLRKVLSDIDDTLFCSGGHFPAGVDKRFPKRQIYPGVLALFRELGRQQPHPHNPASPEYRRSRTFSRQVKEKRRSASPQASRRRQLADALFANLARVRRSPLVPPSPSSCAIWLRVSQEEWAEVSVPTSETVRGLRSRLDALRDEAGAGVGSCLELEGLPEVSFSPPTRRDMSNLVFISARPHAYKDYMESKSYQLFRRLRARGMLHCMPTLLAGRFRSSSGAALRGAIFLFRAHLGAVMATLLVLAGATHRTALHPHVVACLLLLGGYAYLTVTTAQQHRHLTSVWAPVGQDKKTTYFQYQRLYCECDTLFFGDNGQGDLLCAELVAASSSKNGAPVVHSFIHEVVPPSEMLTSLSPVLSPEGKAKIWSSKNIRFHRTYVGAAINACDCGLLPVEGLARVARSAVEDTVRLCAVHLASGHPASKATCERLVREINQDVEAANAMLPEGVPLVDLVPSSLGIQQELQRGMFQSVSVNNFAFSTMPPGPDID